MAVMFALMHAKNSRVVITLAVMGVVELTTVPITDVRALCVRPIRLCFMDSSFCTIRPL